MNTRAVFLAGSLVLATAITSAKAADIYAPSAGGLKDAVVGEQVVIPETTAYQENAEWFIRGNVGFGGYSSSIDSDAKVETGAFASTDPDFEKFFSASIGFGRYVTPNVRLGLDVDYRHHADGDFSSKGASIAALKNLGPVPLELTTTSIMFSAIYDFAPSRRISPYFGGGIGWAFHTLEMGNNTYTNDYNNDGTDDTGTVAGSDNSSNHFAANLVAGASVALRQGLFLDLGYRFSYLGNADTDFKVTHAGLSDGSDSGKMEIEDIMTHEFRVGLRYDLY